jgi:CRISPR-associated protein Csx14
VKSLNDQIAIPVDICNPGQFFACCGLFELADRLYRGAEAWFDSKLFCLAAATKNCEPSLRELLSAIHAAKLELVDSTNEMTTPMVLPDPFRLRLDWWNDTRSGGSELKTWAGQQKVVRIARAMHATLADPQLHPASLLNSPAVLFDTEKTSDTVEPFYFDARRAAQAHAVDIGFSPDAQNMTMPVFAAVEFLCLVGLQRFRPSSADDAGARRYRTWHVPLLPAVAAAVVSGKSDVPYVSEFRFRLLYRTKYLKGFLNALPNPEVTHE